MREIKGGIATITAVVTRKRIATSRRKSQENSIMKDRKNGVAFTIAVVVRTRSITSREIAINVRIVVTMIVKIVKNVKPML